MPGLDAADVQDIIDHIEQMPPAGFDVIGVFKVFGAAGWAEHLFPDNFRKPDNGVEWCAKLMAHGR